MIGLSAVSRMFQKHSYPCIKRYSATNTLSTLSLYQSPTHKQILPLIQRKTKTKTKTKTIINNYAYIHSSMLINSNNYSKKDSDNEIENDFIDILDILESVKKIKN